MPGKKIKLFIADDHGIVRQGLRLILQAEPDMVVVGEATNGLEAVKRARVGHVPAFNSTILDHLENFLRVSGPEVSREHP